MFMVVLIFKCFRVFFAKYFTCDNSVRFSNFVFDFATILINSSPLIPSIFYSYDYSYGYDYGYIYDYG